jgi:hypothetical protein
MIMIELFHNASQTKNTGDLDQERYDHLAAVCELLLIEGEILEFGVYQGSTINFMAEKFPNQTLYGFDSFEGLPEDWNISYKEKYNKHKKGYFAVDNLPQVKSNVRLVKGFFDTSLPKWLKENNLDKISLLHIDSDLYSSAKIIFDKLNDYIVPGTIIVFDEFYPWGRKRYETWEEHEYKALCEWVDTYKREFEVLYRNNHQQCSIRITK